jgi:ATP-dependent phosphoenolpyruvate carboxykinase
MDTEARAAGRSTEIARVQEFELMIQSTRTAMPEVRAVTALGRSLQANLSTAALYEVATRDIEGLIAADGPLVVRTGKHTGRSPLDKFVVREASSQAKICWGEVNQPIS